MWQILGNLYKRDIILSKDFIEIKELIRGLLLKEPLNTSIKDIVLQLKTKKGFKDCNLFTVLKAIEEVCNEENTETKSLNITIKELIIDVDTIPF